MIHRKQNLFFSQQIGRFEGEKRTFSNWNFQFWPKMTVFDTSNVQRWSKNMFYQRMIRFRAGNIGLICDPVIYTTRNRNLFVHGILVRRFTPCSIPIIHRNTLWLHNSLILSKNILFHLGIDWRGRPGFRKDFRHIPEFQRVMSVQFSHVMTL